MLVPPSAPFDRSTQVPTSVGLPPGASTDEAPHSSLMRLRARLQHDWWAGAGWLRVNSFQPAWVPARWRHPLTGYVAAGLVQGLAILLTLLLLAAFHSFAFPGMLALLGGVGVALAFGAGPSLLAVLVGAVLLWVIVLPPKFSWTLSREGDTLALALWVTVGLTMSLLASRAEHARRAAQAATRQRDAFLSMASHELRTPLTTIQGHVQLLARHLDRAEAGTSSVGELATSGRRTVVGIDKGTRRMGRLVSDMLDVSRIQAGKLELRLAPCDLAAVVREVVEERRQQQPDRDIRLELPAAPVPVLADADRIDAVVTNYLTNALKYAAEDQPIEVALHVQEETARVSVRDRGPGLPLEEQKRVWEQFYRVSSIGAVSGSSFGLGLGLYICRTFVELHRGGQVGVESEIGHGSTFWFTLPLLPATDR